MTLESYILVARFMYRFGRPVLEDAEYDGYIRNLKAQGITFNPIYEDDPIPYDKLHELGVTDEEIKDIMGPATETIQDSEAYRDLIEESSSLSISPVHTFQEAYDWALNFKDIEMIFTPKLDGINTRRGYEYKNGKLIYRIAMTRGRRSDALNITPNMRYISPTDIATDKITHSLVINSETFLPAMDIPHVCEKYSVSLKIPRNAGMSLMRVSTYEPEDIKRLKSLVFKCDVAPTLSEGLDIAEQMGFEVVPYTLMKFNLESLGAFTRQIETLIQDLHTFSSERGWPTDGVVVEVNSRLESGKGDIHNGYSSTNLALKVGLWEPGVYESVIKEIEMVQQAEQCNCVAIVEPVVAQGGQTISRVNMFNPSIMISRDLFTGSKIRFKYKNETTVDLI